MIVTPPLLHQGTTAMTRPQKRKWLIKIIHSIILACRTIQMLIYCLFHSVNLSTLMETTTLFGVIKFVVIYSLSILAFGN
jgi:hypothetical protein